jgi:hypothetical protein
MPPETDGKRKKSKPTECAQVDVIFCAARA